MHGFVWQKAGSIVPVCVWSAPMLVCGLFQKELPMLMPLLRVRRRAWHVPMHVINMIMFIADDALKYVVNVKRHVTMLIDFV
jgi:hypothetical protein